MARLLRSYPPKPHVAPPIVAPGGPVVPGQTVVLAKERARYQRRGAPKPHLAAPIVAPGGPVVPGATTCYQTAPRKRPNVGRWWPKPHLPGSIVAPGGPVVPGATIKLNDENRKARPERRGAPKPHLPGAIVAPGGPVVPGSTVVLTTPPRRWKRNPAKPQVAGPVLTTPVTPPVGPGTYIYNALKRVVLRRDPPKAHLAKPVVAPGGPVVAGQTVVTQKPAKRWKRNPQKPVVPGPVVAPGGPVVAGQTILLNKENRVGRTNLRGAPKPHVAPPNLTQPAAQAPVARGSFIYAKIRRRLQRLFLPPPIIGTPPAPPAPVIPTEFTASPPIPYWTASTLQNWWNTGNARASRWEVGEPSVAWVATQALVEPLAALSDMYDVALPYDSPLPYDSVPYPEQGTSTQGPSSDWQTGEPRT